MRGRAPAEEAPSARDPVRAIEGRPTAWHDAVDMWVLLQGPPPGVQNHGHAELGAEVLRIAFQKKQAALLQESRQPCGAAGLRAPHQRTPAPRLDGLRQVTVWGPRTGAGLSRPLQCHTSQQIRQGWRAST